MTFDIDWTFFLNVTTKDKSDRIVQRIRDVLSFDLSAIKIERYWKQDTQFKVSARSRIEGIPRDTFYTVMKTVKPLANRWIVTVPDEEGSFEFVGAANSEAISVQGVDSIGFHLSQPAEANISFQMEQPCPPR